MTRSLLSALLPTNEGGPDRVIRIGLGLVVLLFGFAFASWWGLLCLVPLLTGLVGFCPLYALFGLRTCPLPTGPPARG